MNIWEGERTGWRDRVKGESEGIFLPSSSIYFLSLMLAVPSSLFSFPPSPLPSSLLLLIFSNPNNFFPLFPLNILSTRHSVPILNNHHYSSPSSPSISLTLILSFLSPLVNFYAPLLPSALLSSFLPMLNWATAGSQQGP